VKSDVLIPPAVNPAYYTHHLDILTHVRAIQLGRKMLATPPLVGIYEGEYEPGPSVVGDASLEEWARKTVSSDNHVVGSLAMMPRPMGGVVDTKLKVYGTGNVRVVGTSHQVPPSDLLHSKLCRCLNHPNADQCTSCKSSKDRPSPGEN